MSIRSALLFFALAGCTMRSNADAGRAPASEAPATEAPAPHVRLIPAPPGPDATAVIAAQRAQTEAAHRRLLVYEGATWCEPCRRFHDAAAKGELDAKLPDLDLLEFDADADRDRLHAAGYQSQLIPLFAVPGADGRPTGRQTEGGFKGDHAVADLVPRVQALLTP
jgi:hypothetical protein